MSDNTSPMNANEYDEKISLTIPHYQEFHNQTISIIKNQGYQNIHWLDTGCGTGSLVRKAASHFPNATFVLADPSAKMISIAKTNTAHLTKEYLVKGSQQLHYENAFTVVTAIQSHHYTQKEERIQATINIYNALQVDGIYIFFENVIPANPSIKDKELQRWGQYQKEHGKTDIEVAKHLARCGTQYFPLPIEDHLNILQTAGFTVIHVFWLSYLQAGIYAIK